MIYVIVAMRDRTADVFATPSYHVSLGGAIRGFTDEINRQDANNMLNKHPEDFDLFHLGTYDDQEAVFNLLEKPRQVCIGKDVKVRE